MSPGPGRVALVGAGPGDPDLLTRRAARRLAEAELVLYDALVDARVLELAPHARRFCVGKRAGRASVRQETIERLMVRGARRGLRVVRLKCGDPFVLGRGGEELLALRAAGVPCEVVPGLTTAVVAPELSGIPVTHRGLASSFVVVSGHEPRAYRPVLESLAPHAATLVVLMGLRTRSELAGVLLARGWRVTTPVAVCLAAGGAASRTWLGTLHELGQAQLDEDGDPGTIVIGDVVALAHGRADERLDERLPAAVGA